MLPIYQNSKYNCQAYVGSISGVLETPVKKTFHEPLVCSLRMMVVYRMRRRCDRLHAALFPVQLHLLTEGKSWKNRNVTCLSVARVIVRN